MFPVVAKKSRTSFCFPCSAGEQECKSWEGAQPGSQPKTANGNIPYHICYAQFMKGGLVRGLEALSLFREFESLLSQEFKLLGEFSLFREF